MFCLFLLHAYSTRVWKQEDASNVPTTATDTQASKASSNAHTTATGIQARKDASDTETPTTGASSASSFAADIRATNASESQMRLIIDGPWKLLWPCFLLWPINEAVLGFAWIHNAVGRCTCADLVSSVPCQSDLLADMAHNQAM